MLKKLVKKGLTFILAFVLAICFFIGVMPTNRAEAASSYTADWQRWSQGASGYPDAMQYGCRVTAYAKMLAEAGYTGFGNPDGFFDWGKARGYFRASDTSELTGFGVAPVTYVNSNGGTASLVGYKVLSKNKAADANTIMNLINQGYYVILTRPVPNQHSVYVGREASISQGTAVVLESWASRREGPSFKYANYTDVAFEKAYYFKITGNANNPTGVVDAINGGAESITVSGWAFDRDAVGTSLEIHVYIGGPAGSGEGHRIVADKTRTDVNAVYGVGNNHGYLDSIQTSKRGYQDVYVYAINVGSGQNVELGHGTVYIDNEKNPPVLSNARVTDISSSGYTVYVDVSDESGVARVQFPTWTEANGQDDLISDWTTNPKCCGNWTGPVTLINGNGAIGTWTFRVNTSDHNNESGAYITHIYAYDIYGNVSSYAVPVQYIPEPDTTPPVISNVKITELSPYGYTITADVSDDSGINRIQFPTWTTANGKDDLAADWETNPACKGTIENGTVTFHVKISDHNNERGVYNTHIHAYDVYGNVNSYEVSATVPETFEIVDGILKKYYGDDVNVVIPEGVTSIGEDAFKGYSNLETITIPEGVTSIGNSAFSECINLENVTLPYGVTGIGDNAFYECSNLKNITIPESVKNIGNSAFARCGFENITIPGSVKSIGWGVFFNCRNLKTIMILEGLTSIEGYAFSNCKKLKTITIPESVTSVGGYAFFGCESLETIIIPEGVTGIEEETFFCCSSLKSITIPVSVTRIGRQAFSYCNSLESVTLLNKAADIDENAFSGSDALKTLIGRKGSGTETFANEKGYEFVPLDKEDTLSQSPSEKLDNMAGTKLNEDMSQSSVASSEEPALVEIVTRDVTGDVKVTLADAKLVLQAALNLTKLNENQKKAADVNGNYKIELKDAQKILRVALNLDTFN